MTDIKKICALLIVLLITCSIVLTGCKKQKGGSVIKAGNIIILDTRTDQADPARAKQNAEDALMRFPDIDCLVGLCGCNGPSILSAVKDAGKQNKVKIVCFDEYDDALQGVMDGYIHGTVVQQPYKFGYLSVKILAALAKGDKSMIPESKIIDVPVKVIKKQNVKEFWDNLKKLLADTKKAVSKPSADQGKEKTQIAFLANCTADFWRIAHEGIKKGEIEFGAECQFLMPPTGSTEEQQRILESVIAKKISGIAISPIDPSNQTELINNACKTMNVITQDSDAPNSNRICYVGTNNYKAGREAGKLIREALPQGGKIVIFAQSL
ncbi:MAG: substrate-binding domain-containing protein, partial [Planctomycetota bacterium]